MLNQNTLKGSLLKRLAQLHQTKESQAVNQVMLRESLSLDILMTLSFRVMQDSLKTTSEVPILNTLKINDYSYYKYFKY